MANTPIFVRSPRIIEITGSANDSTKLEIYLWNDPDSIPANPTYTLEKPIPSSIATTCYYDISPYCRNYINHLQYAEVTGLTAADFGEYCYCTTKSYQNDILQTTNEYIAFDGFGYYEDGYNPNPITSFMTEGTYYVSEVGNSGGLYYHNNLALTWEAKYTGLTSGGTTTVTLTHEYGYVPYIHSSYVGEGNKLEILKNSVVQATYYFEEVCEPKYTIHNCDFVNKYGSWQRLVFFKTSKKSVTGTSKKYNFLLDTLTDYDATAPTRKVFNKNAQEEITLNTGWVTEEYSEVMKELLLSETILIDDEPVILKTENIKLQEGINDRNINYECNFNYAYKMLNYNI